MKAKREHSSSTQPKSQKIRSSNPSRNLATRHRNNLQKEIRWLLEEKYRGKRTTETEKDIARFKKGEHIDYVIGFVNFLGCKIDLSQRPFIPRPETEFWVEKAIQEITRRKRSARASLIRCLDIFAGSGCIGIGILKRIPYASVDFAEKEKKFLKQIEISAKRNNIERKRYRLIQSDIFSSVKGKYDYILANPPYVAEARKKKMQKSVLENEPLQAVFGGKDGLAYIKRFLREAKNYLKKDGKIYMEFDAPQKREIEKLLKKCGYQNFEISKDQYGKWRYVKIYGRVIELGR